MAPLALALAVAVAAASTMEQLVAAVHRVTLMLSMAAWISCLAG